MAGMASYLKARELNILTSLIIRQRQRVGRDLSFKMWSGVVRKLIRFTQYLAFGWKQDFI